MKRSNLKYIINIFWNKRLQITSIIFIFLIIGVIYTFTLVTPKYKSYTSLTLTKINNQTGDESGNTTTQTLDPKLISIYSDPIKRKIILREVIANLNIDETVEVLSNNITVTIVKDTNSIEINVTNYYPDRARDIANEIVKVFTRKLGEMYGINNVYILDEAESSKYPYNINHVKDILIFTLIGAIISILYVLTQNLLDTTVKEVEKVEKVLDTMVLASIPVLKDKSKKRGGEIR